MGDFARSYCSGYGGDDGGKCRRRREGKGSRLQGEGVGGPAAGRGLWWRRGREGTMVALLERVVLSFLGPSPPPASGYD